MKIKVLNKGELSPLTSIGGDKGFLIEIIGGNAEETRKLQQNFLYNLQGLHINPHSMGYPRGTKRKDFNGNRQALVISLTVGEPK